MKVRPYLDSDLERVALLFTASVHSLASSCYDVAQRLAWAPQPPNLDEWRLRLSSRVTLVVEESSQLSGFVSYERNGHIDLLYTAPACARRGVASTLYRHAETALFALGAEELFTEASLVARPFFERQGFRVAEEQCVYRRGVSFTRYCMRKSLIAKVRLENGDAQF